MSEKQLKIKIDAPKPTKEELEFIIKPLIPEPKQGEKGKDGKDGVDGKNYKLTQADKREIAKTIKVPIVEKIVERTEVIKEQPIIKEVAINETPEVLKEKILNIGITYEEIKETPNIPEIVRNATIASKTTSLSELDDVNLAGLTQTNGKYNLGSGSSSGTVTSVAVTGSDGIEVDSGSPVTTTGTIALGVNKTSMLSHLNVEDGADVTDATNVNAAGAVMNSDYTPAHSILVQQSGTGSPTALQIGNNTLVGRIAGGGSNIDDLSASQVRTLLNVENGAEVNNISDTNATDLTDGGNTTLHIHDSRYYTETETDALLADKANIVIDTQEDILFSTPTSETVAYATDKEQFYVFDGTDWQESSSYFGVRNENLTVGASQVSNVNDIGRDFIANKRLSNIKLGGYNKAVSNSDNDKGSLKGEIDTVTGDYEMYMWSTISETWRRFLAGISLRNDVTNQALVTDDFYDYTINLFTGDSLEVDGNGLPMVQRGSVSVGAFQRPPIVEGGSF